MREKKKKVYPILQNVTVLDAGSEGVSIARDNDGVLFVDGAIPGDVVDVQIFQKKKNYRHGKAIQFHQLSDRRTQPVCKHFGTCGGCKWQHMEYASQLFYKQKQVIDALERLGKIELPACMPILASESIYHYRNKLEFTFSNKRWLTVDEMNQEGTLQMNALGFHIPKMFDKILDIDTCHLMAEPINGIKNFIRQYAFDHKLTFFDLKAQVGFLRNLIIRNTSTGELMVIVIFHKQEEDKHVALLNALLQAFPQITALMYVFNEKRNDTISDLPIMLHAGKDHMVEEMEGLKFKVGPKSFYQTNAQQAYNLYKITRDFAQLTGNETVYDLYTGTGTIANFVAHQCKHIVGIEYVDAAIEDARLNAQLNNLSNTSFYAGDMKDVLTDDLIAKHGKADVIITDPPRAGMHADVVQKMIEVAPKRIVYVSCNPATQARDLALMDAHYKVTKVQPVDMFPHTYHVENVVLLERRN